MFDFIGLFQGTKKESKEAGSTPTANGNLRTSRPEVRPKPRTEEKSKEREPTQEKVGLRVQPVPLASQTEAKAPLEAPKPKREEPPAKKKPSVMGLKSLIKSSYQQNTSLEHFRVKTEPKREVPEAASHSTESPVSPEAPAPPTDPVPPTPQPMQIEVQPSQEPPVSAQEGAGKKGPSKKFVEFHEKKFKSTGVGVKLNMKQKFKDNFLGNTFNYKTKFLPNGRSKSFYRQAQKEEEDKIDELAPAKMEVSKITMTADKTIITKDNLYFQFMSEAVRFQLINEDCPEVGQDQRGLLDAKIANQVTSPQLKAELQEMPHDQILKRFFKHESFYEFQSACLGQMISHGQDLLVNSFTGSGKSLLFQFFSFVQDGLTVVVAPYVSMVVDQIRKVPAELPAVAFNSWLSRPQRDRFFRMIKNGKIRLAFVTPELFNSDFLEFLLQNMSRISLKMVCVDEAHCCIPNSISYRPAYSCLGSSLRQLRRLTGQDFRLLLLTATADFNTRAYLSAEFGLPPANVTNNGEYLRRNFAITFSETTDQRKTILEILREKFAKKRPVLLFCSFNKNTEMVSTFLTQNNINSLYFHSNLSEIQKMTILQKFALSCDKFQQEATDPLKRPAGGSRLDNEADGVSFFAKTEVVLSTISLSMGLDIPNIKGIIHFNLPKCLEIYIQQIGRSGRSGELSYCETLLNKSDYYFSRNKSISEYLIDPTSIEKVVRFCLGERELGDSPVHNFVDKDKIKKRFGLEVETFNWVLNFVRLALRETWGVDLALFLGGKSVFRLIIGKAGSAAREKLSGEEVDFLEKFTNENKHQFFGDLFEAGHLMGESSVAVLMRLVVIADKTGWELFLDNQGVGVEMVAPAHHSVQEVLAATQSTIKKYFEEVLFKIDVFYFLCSYLQKFNNKPDNFAVFKDLCQQYFNRPPGEFRELMESKFRYRDLCPLIFIDSQQSFEQFVLPVFEVFFLENHKRVVADMKSARTHFKSFADSLRLLLGTTSDTYELKDWRNSKHWGALEHFSFHNFYGEIESYFKEAFLAEPLQMEVEGEEPGAQGQPVEPEQWADSQVDGGRSQTKQRAKF